MKWRLSSMCTAIILLAMSTDVIAQSCLVNNLPMFEDQDGRPHIDTDKLQFIIPSYTFNCHGRVVQYGACVQPGGNPDNDLYELELQVLRPLPVDQNNIQCFSVVGSYSQTGGPNSPPDNIDFCILIDIPSDDQIPVQPGDVVGFYYDLLRNDGGGVQLDEDREDVTVFYRERASIPAPTISSCMLIAGLNNIDITTTAAPVITVVVETVIAPSPTPPVVARSPTPPVVAPSPTPPTVTTDDPPVTDPVEGSVAPSKADESPTSPNPGPTATSPSGGGISMTAVIGIVIGLLLVIIVVLVVWVILFALRRKKQKAIVLEQPQGAVLESRESMIRNDAYTAVIATERNEAYMTNADVIPSPPREPGKETFEMTGNDAYSTAITTERNEAYMTNTDAIPAARNMAYGAVATELEGEESLNREDTRDQCRDEYSYAYVH